MDLCYAAVLRAALDTPWAIQPEKLEAIAAFLATKAAGREVDPEAAALTLGGGGAAQGIRREGNTAIIPVLGTITYRSDSLMSSSGMTSTQRLSAWLREAMADPAVKNILLDINSPGGTVPGVGEFAAELLAAREKKPIVAFANPMAASAAYWIASAASKIVMLPSGEIGSIGTFSIHQDLSHALRQEGVTTTIIKAGKYKTEGNPYEPLSEDARANRQERVNALNEIFIRAVAKGRGVTADQVKSGYGEGRMFFADKAVALGMADQVGTIDQVLRDMNDPKRGASLLGEAAAIETNTELARSLKDLAAQMRA
jgi:signal peptide peptidase SppA